MVRVHLTPELIKDGAALIARLDADGNPPDAALWVYSDEKGYWTLLLADARLRTEGPYTVLEPIQKAVRALQDELAELSFFDIAIQEPDAPLLERLRKTVVLRRGHGGMRLGRQLDVDDAYVYRLESVRRPREVRAGVRRRRSRR